MLLRKALFGQEGEGCAVCSGRVREGQSSSFFTWGFLDEEELEVYGNSK